MPFIALHKDTRERIDIILRTVYTRAGVELTDPQEGCKLVDIKHKKIPRRNSHAQESDREYNT